VNTHPDPVLTRKHKTKLERLARFKHSSLIRTFVSCGREKFYNIGLEKINREKDESVVNIEGGKT
jgi:hypothetical protein